MFGEVASVFPDVGDGAPGPSRFGGAASRSPGLVPASPPAVLRRSARLAARTHPGAGPIPPVVVPASPHTPFVVFSDSDYADCWGEAEADALLNSLRCDMGSLAEESAWLRWRSDLAAADFRYLGTVARLRRMTPHPTPSHRVLGMRPDPVVKEEPAP